MAFFTDGKLQLESNLIVMLKHLSYEKSP